MRDHHSTRLSCSEGEVVVRRGNYETRLRFSDVVQIQGVKLDKITLEENFLVFKTAKGDQMEIGELFDGFDNLESSLTASFQGFPQNWRARLENGPSQRFLALWPVE